MVSSFGKNRIPVTTTDGDYSDLTDRAFRYLRSMRGRTLTAHEAAAAIAELVELDDPPLRVPIGDEAGRLTAERHTVGDAVFEETVLSNL